MSCVKQLNLKVSQMASLFVINIIILLIIISNSSDAVNNKRKINQKFNINRNESLINSNKKLNSSKKPFFKKNFLSYLIPSNQCCNNNAGNYGYYNYGGYGYGYGGSGYGGYGSSPCKLCSFFQLKHYGKYVYHSKKIKIKYLFHYQILYQ